MRTSFRSRIVACVGAAILVLAACGSDDTVSTATTASTAAPATTAASGAATTAASDSTSAAATTGAPTTAGSATTAAPNGTTTKVRFALDWTPNTNHTGLYVAIHEGYFKAAGIDLEVLPYNSTSPDLLVGNDAAEFGISFHGSLTFSRAAGIPIKSVMAVVQHDVTGLGVRADRTDINSPKDLDGKTYAGFGGPGEQETIAQVIKNDGGTGKFESVTLSTAAYEAVYSGAADFTEPFITWEGIEAKLKGTPFKIFKPVDYGFPDEYAVVVIGQEKWLADHPDVAKAFVGSLQKGYQYGVDHPKEAAQILIDENPGAFSSEELVFESQAMLAASYFTDASGKVGPQTLAQWTGYSKFFYDQGLLTNENGDKLTAPPDYSAFFTNEYLSTS